MTRMRTILQLCADTGSDTWAYRNDPRYEVITVGADVGVENYSPDRPIHGIIANPVCTEFSPARRGDTFGGGERKPADPESMLWMVDECIRIIEEAQPKWYAIENPATSTLWKYMEGDPLLRYEPWQYGSPWTKKTALWGEFTVPEVQYTDWDDVPKIQGLYARPGRKPSLAFMHKSAFFQIPEFHESGMPVPDSDMEFRSLCSQKFALAFKTANP